MGLEELEQTVRTAHSKPRGFRHLVQFLVPDTIRSVV